MSTNTDIGLENRYHEWMENVEKWANRHKITTDQAISILSDHPSNNRIDYKELTSWVEYEHFIGMYNKKISKMKMILFFIASIIFLPLVCIWMHIRHPKVMLKSYKEEYEKKGIIGMLTQDN